MLYDTKSMSIQMVADYYGVGHSTIHSRMKEYGIERRGLSEVHIGNKYATATRKYSINEDFFKTWTPESAWMFGWALGDGCFTDHRMLIIYLAQKDREVLDKMKEVLESEHPIHDYRRWDKRYRKYRYRTGVQFCSTEIVSDLRKQSFYDVPECYFDHALRGFFEAEGCVYWNACHNQKGAIGVDISQNDYDLLCFIRRKLQELNIVKRGGIHAQGDTAHLKFSVFDSISLYHYMYKNCGNMFLKRKVETFEKLIGMQRKKRKWNRKLKGEEKGN